VRLSVTVSVSAMSIDAFLCRGRHQPAYSV